MFDIDTLPEFLILAVGLAALHFIPLGIASICRAMPSASRATIGLSIYLCLTYFPYAPLAQMTSRKVDDRLAIPFNIPLEIVRDPWRSISAWDLWQTGCWNPMNLYVLLYLVNIMAFIRATPVLPILTLPWLIQRVLEAFDSQPENRGPIAGTVALIVLISGFALLSTIDLLALPCWVTVYVVCLAITNLAAVGSTDLDQSVAYVTAGGAVGALLKTFLDPEIPVETAMAFRHEISSAFIVHVVLLLAFCACTCSPAINVFQAVFSFWFSYFDIRL